MSASVLTTVPSDPTAFDDWFRNPPVACFARRISLSRDETAIVFCEGATHFAALTIAVNTKSKRVKITMNPPEWRWHLTFFARSEPNLYNLARRAIRTGNLDTFARSLIRRGRRDNRERSEWLKVAGLFIQKEVRKCEEAAAA